MFKRLCVLVLLLSPLSAWTQGMEDLKLQTLAGEWQSLQQLANHKPLYVKFWATWCQPCMAQMPHFEEVQKKYGKQISVVAVNLGVNDQATDIEKVIEQFGLTMPVLVDTHGQVATAVQLLGTPLHLLITPQGNIVHRGHNANTKLDEVLADLASRRPDLEADSLAVAQDVAAPQLPKNGAVLYTATWCDWYWEKTRPVMSDTCSAANRNIDGLAKRFPQLSWQVVVSRLWTGEAELAEYRSKYKLQVPASVDYSNRSFVSQRIMDYPALVLYQNGEEVMRALQFNDAAALEQQIAGVLNQ